MSILIRYTQCEVLAFAGKNRCLLLWGTRPSERSRLNRAAPELICLFFILHVLLSDDRPHRTLLPPKYINCILLPLKRWNPRISPNCLWCSGRPPGPISGNASRVNSELTHRYLIVVVSEKADVVSFGAHSKVPDFAIEGSSASFIKIHLHGWCAGRESSDGGSITFPQRFEGGFQFPKLQAFEWKI